MKKLFYSTIIGIIISSAFVCYSDTIQSDVAHNVMRLHVIANSDQEFDQNLKLKVRDRILEQSKDIFKDCNSLSECKVKITENIDFLKQIAQDEIHKNGYNYSVKLSLGKFDFPVKKYENITLPSGKYDALRVEIGKAEGKNWWCVMFPPLCFVDASLGKSDKKSMQTLKQNLSSESYEIISGSSLPVEMRFKIVDFIQASTKTIKTALK